MPWHKISSAEIIQEMAEKHHYALIKIHVSKFEFAGTERIETFDDLEEAQVFVDKNPEYGKSHGNGWNDSHMYRIVEIRDDNYYSLKGELFDPEFGKSIIDPKTRKFII